MKKIVLVLIIVCSFVTFSAQAQTKLGISAGFNQASMIFSSSDFTFDTGNRFTFTAGGVAEIPLFNNLAMQTGMMFTGKGYKVSLLGASSATKTTFVEVPLLLKYRKKVWEEEVFALAGPYAGYGLFGKSGDIQVFKDGEYPWNRFEWGLMIGSGWETQLKGKDLQVFVTYSIGLNNISTTGEGTQRNSVLGFRLQYFPWQKGKVDGE